MFEDVNARSILNAVAAKLDSESARSLWRRLEAELSTGGTPAVDSYILMQFDDLRTEVERALADLENSAKDSSLL